MAVSLPAVRSAGGRLLYLGRGGSTGHASHVAAELDAVDQVYLCRHAESSACECRKPLPGFLIQALTNFDSRPEGVGMVGDRWKDIEAARAAGVSGICIDDIRYDEPEPPHFDRRAKALLDALDTIESTLGI